MLQTKALAYSVSPLDRFGKELNEFNIHRSGWSKWTSRFLKPVECEEQAITTEMKFLRDNTLTGEGKNQGFDSTWIVYGTFIQSYSDPGQALMIWTQILSLGPRNLLMATGLAVPLNIKVNWHSTRALFQ